MFTKDTKTVHVYTSIGTRVQQTKSQISKSSMQYFYYFSFEYIHQVQAIAIIVT